LGKGGEFLGGPKEPPPGAKKIWGAAPQRDPLPQKNTEGATGGPTAPF